MHQAHDQYYAQGGGGPPGTIGYDLSNAANQQGSNQPPHQINVSGLMREVRGLEGDDDEIDSSGAIEG
jgi:hypothetical protein